MKITNTLFRAAMLSTISVASLGLSSVAYAQDATAPDEETASEDEDVIIVTATKREQTLQEVPISVSVTSGETIERAQVRDLNDLQTLVPSLKVGQLQSSANTNFIIRGFGNGANNAGIEPSVGVFIDGVYRSRSAAQIGDLANISRVEVLRGPQSTLFGKNASAGIISIVTKAPQFEFGGGVEVSYGNYDAIVVRGNVTGPISDTVAVAIEGNYNKRDGYINVVNLNTDSNNRNRYGLRGQVLFEPSDTLKFRLIADYDKIDEECCGVANVVDGPTGAIIRGIGGRLNSNQPFSYDVFQNFESVNKIKNYGISGQADLELSGTLDLTSITAYRGVDSFTDQDSDFTSADLLRKNSTDTEIRTFTQELRLASNFDGPINFLLGGYYFNEKIDIANDIEYGAQFRAFSNQLILGATRGALSLFPTPPGTAVPLDATFGALEGAPGRYIGQFGAAGQGLDEVFTLKDTAYSIFGTVDFEITDKLILTGGFNYTKDKKRFSGNINSTDVFSGINFNAAAYAPFRQALLVGGGVPPALASFLAVNPTTKTLPDGVTPLTAVGISNANPLSGLRPLQFLPPFLNFPNSVENGRTSDSDLSYSVRLAYEFSNNLNAYVSYATGFKASSVNLSRDSRPSPADQGALTSASLLRVNQTFGSRFAGPEDATVYEIGVKGKFDGFGFNLALFKQTLEGFQSNVFQGTGFVLGNAEKQSTKGMEIDATITPTRGLNFTASYTYLDPKFDSFTGGSAFNATNNVVATNLTGRTPSGISKHSVSVGGTYDIDVGSGNALILHTDYQLNSAFQIAQGLPNKAAIESLNASIAFAFENGLEFSIWGRNLTEPEYNPVLFPSVAQSGSLSGYQSPPTTYGASARFKF